MSALGASARHGTVMFSVWAPRCRSLQLIVDGRPLRAMRQAEDGLFETSAELAPGTRYQFRLDGGHYRPDPVSRWQPEGVHGPSVVVDPASFAWSDAGFSGHAPTELVFYE